MNPLIRTFFIKKAIASLDAAGLGGILGALGTRVFMDKPTLTNYIINAGLGAGIGGGGNALFEYMSRNKGKPLNIVNKKKVSGRKLEDVDFSDPVVQKDLINVVKKNIGRETNEKDVAQLLKDPAVEAFKERLWPPPSLGGSWTDAQHKEFEDYMYTLRKSLEKKQGHPAPIAMTISALANQAAGGRLPIDMRKAELERLKKTVNKHRGVLSWFINPKALDNAGDFLEKVIDVRDKVKK